MQYIRIRYLTRNFDYNVHNTNYILYKRDMNKIEHVIDMLLLFSFFNEILIGLLIRENIQSF